MYWQGHCRRDDEIMKIIEGRNKATNDSLTCRDKIILDSLDSCNHNLKSLYYEQVNLRKAMESIALRQSDLIKSNVKMLDWAMATVSRNKKVAVPKITISNYVPCVIVPPNGQNFVGPLESQETTKPKEGQKKKQSK